MTRVFDGMARSIAGVLGDAVDVSPTGAIASGSAVRITAILRDEPVEIIGDEGEPVWAVQPTLKACRPDVVDLRAGDRVTGALGRFVVLYRLPADSPAADRLETFVLQRVDA